MLLRGSGAWLWRLLITTLAYALLPGCDAGTQATSGADRAAPLPASLQAWANFPIPTSPRPILVLYGATGSDTVGTGGEPAAFPDVDLKLAYNAGAIDPPSRFPSGPAAAVGVLDRDAGETTLLT